MAKFFARLGSKKELHLVLMKILQIEIAVTESYERISIEWKRGEKKSETKAIFDLSTHKQFTLINETFSKNSQFYFAPKSQTYFKKMTLIRVKGYNAKGKECSLGEVEIDISQFVGAQNTVKAVQLLKTPAKTSRAFITLQISILKDTNTDPTAAVSSGDDEEQTTTASQVVTSSSMISCEEHKNSTDPSAHQFKPALLEEIEMRKNRVAELESKYTELKSKVEGVDAEHQAQKEQLENEFNEILQQKAQANQEEQQLDHELDELNQQFNELAQTLSLDPELSLEDLQSKLEHHLQITE